MTEVHKFETAGNQYVVSFGTLPANNISKYSNADGYHYHTWGSDNKLPTNREIVLMDNNIVGEMISTKRSLILGLGLQPYKTIYRDGKKYREPVSIPTQIADWIESSMLKEKYLDEAANQLLKHANIFVGLLPERNSTNIKSLMTYKCTDIRVGHNDFGRPVRNYIYKDWGNTQRDKKTTPISIPKYVPGIRSESMIHTMDMLFNNGVYAHPAYWGGSEWLELSNRIPKYHLANIDNGYAIRFHIEIPKDAFLDSFKYQQAEMNNDMDAMNQCHNESKARRQEFIDSMNKFLSGSDNAGRAIYTFFEYNEDAKKIDGVTITPITYDSKDKDLLDLFEKSNDANISAQGIHPSIANIQTQGKMSSGNEIRNSIETFVKIKAGMPRSLILKPILKAFEINGFDTSLEWGFEDVVLETLDESPSGTNNILSPAAK
jgi:hypothetical protein